MIRIIRFVVFFCIALATVILVPTCDNGREESSMDNVTTVVMWAHEGQPEEKAAIQTIIDAFNASHDNITVQLEFKQEQGYGQRVNAAAISGMLPDVLDVDGPYTAHFASLGVLAPLDTFITESERADFLPTIITQGTYDNQLYTLGAFESTVVLFCNKPILASCGITDLPDTVSQAWTWNEFIDVLQQIKSKQPDILPLETFMPWSGEWLTYAFTPIIWSNGGRILSPDGIEANGYVNSSKSIEAMEKWQRLFTEELTSKNIPPGQFRDGRAAMAWGVFNRWPLYREHDIDFELVPLPKLEQSSSPSGSWCWGISSQSACKSEAAAVLKWLVDARRGIMPICTANGGIPSRNSAIALMPEYVDTRGLFIEQLRESGHARPVTPAYATLTTELSRAFEDIARGSDVKQALDGVAERWKNNDVGLQ